MANQPADYRHELKSTGNRRFGTGRSFEDVLNEVCRHTSCLMTDLERVKTYLEAVSRKRDNNA